MPTVRARASRAVEIAKIYGYDDEYELDESPLPTMVIAGLDDVPDEDLTGVHRYLVISTEYAGEGPADHAEFFESKSAAVKHMGDYARSGWVSSLYDLDADTIEPIKERSPR